MENETPKPILTDFLEKKTKLIPQVEKISITILILGLILYFLKIKNTEFILIIGSISIAITYLLYAFSVLEIENIETTGVLNAPEFINFIYKLTYLSLSIAGLSILQLTLKNIDFKTVITVSGLTLVIVLILSSLTKLNDRSKIYNTLYYLRIIAAIMILMYLLNVKYKWF
jgi:hypothetical protein